MGRITIYTKDDCTYCDEVHECLRSAAKEALDGIDDGKEGEPNIEVRGTRFPCSFWHYCWLVRFITHMIYSWMELNPNLAE